MWQHLRLRRARGTRRAATALSLSFAAGLLIAWPTAAGVRTYGPERAPSPSNESATPTQDTGTPNEAPPESTGSTPTRDGPPRVKVLAPLPSNFPPHQQNNNPPTEPVNPPGAPPTDGGVIEFRAGNGFSGPPLEPGAVGDLSAPGATAKAIAHWNVVPEQIFKGAFDIGVVAFHINDIDRVEFSLNGGPWTAVREMSHNALTDTWEYWGRIDGADTADGRLEVRAIAYPKTGLPRLLEPLFVYNNAGGSMKQEVRYVALDGNDAQGDGSAQKPFATIWKAANSISAAQGDQQRGSHGTVYLMAGDHLYAGRPTGGLSIDTPGGWLTISAAPGVARDRVRITGNSSTTGGLNSSRVRFKNLTMTSTSLKSPTASNAACWFDGCDLIGNGPEDTAKFASPSSWTGGLYYTDSKMRNIRTALVHPTLARNMALENIGSDCFHNPRLLVNCSAKDVRKPAGTNFHPDLIQFNGAFDNVIVYGLKTQNINAQGIFSRGSDGIPDKNIAFVNVMVDQRSHLSQWLQAADHLLFRNVMILGRPMNISNDAGRPPTTLTNFSVQGCVFQDLRIDPKIVPTTDTTVFRNNHFIYGQSIGSNCTMGDPKLVNPPQGRFEPRADSPLAGRMSAVEIPADILGKERPTPAAIGPFEVASAE